MTQKLTLTFVKREEKISPRNNKPYTSMTIKAKEHGDRYISGFNSKETSYWKEGDVVEVEVTESDKSDKEGRPYLNWKPVDKEKALEDRVVSLEKQVRELVEFINKHFTSAGTPVPTFDVPFNKNIDPIKDVNAELDAIAEEQYRKL